MNTLELIKLALNVGADLHWLFEGFLDNKNAGNDNQTFAAETFADLAPTWKGTSKELAERIYLLSKERE